MEYGKRQTPKTDTIIRGLIYMQEHESTAFRENWSNSDALPRTSGNSTVQQGFKSGFTGL